MDNQSSNPSTAVMVTDSAEKIRNIIQHRQASAHILTPLCKTNIDQVPTGYNVSIRSYTISPDPAMGEVYNIKGRAALTKIGLWQLEILAGVEWEWVKRVDAGAANAANGHPQIRSYQAKAVIVDLDGTERSNIGGASMDLRDESDEAKSLKPEELNMQRRFIDRHCETKAKLRALRELLGLRSSFKPEELTKPFIIFKMIKKRTSDDPLLQRLLEAKALGIGQELFGFLSMQNAQNTIDVEPIQEPLSIPDHIDRDTQISDIEALYLKKKGKTRSELTPDRPPLDALSDSELDAVEAALQNLPDLTV